MPNKEVLHVYSSGAVAPPIKKCAEEFKARFGTEFKFTVGKAESLISEIAESREGDILTSETKSNLSKKYTFNRKVKWLSQH